MLRYQVKNTSWFTVIVYKGFLERRDAAGRAAWDPPFMDAGELKPGEVFEGQYFLERDRPYAGAMAEVSYYWSFPMREWASRSASAIIDHCPGEVQWRIEKLREPREATVRDVELPAEFGAGL